MKELIGFIVKKIEEIADKFGIILDREEIKAEKPKKKIPRTSYYRKKDRKTRELCKLFRRKIAPFIDLNMGINCIYEKGEFLDLLVHLGLTKDFAENGSKTFKQQRKRGPDGDTLLYHLKK